MESQPAAAPSRKSETNPGILRAILVGGIIAGFNDLVFAFVLYGWPRDGATSAWNNIVTMAPRICRGIARGVLGDSARTGGAGTAILGVLLHFLIALIWAAIFATAARFVPFLRRQAVLCGLLYGMVVWLGMNAVVVPLSAVHGKFPPPQIDWKVWVAIVGHMVLIGWPIALAARRWSR